MTVSLKHLLGAVGVFLFLGVAPAAAGPVGDHPLFRQLTGLLIGSLALVVFVVGWNVALRRKVDGQATALKSVELHFAAVFNSLSELAWIKDRDGRYLAANPALARLCGYAGPQEMVGRTDQELFPQEAALTYRRNDLAVMESLRAAVAVEPLIHSDGSTQWIETSKAPLLDGNGRCAGTVGMSRDITARKAAEDELNQTVSSLRASESRLRDLVRVLPVGVFEIDGSGTILFANDLGWHILGGAESERNGPWLSFVEEEDRGRVAAALRRLTEAGAPLEIECRLSRGEGEPPLWVQVLGARRPETGGVIISLSDITGRKLADEELRRREEEFRALAEFAPDTIARYDAECRRLYANPAFGAAAGLPVEELLGRTPRDMCWSSQAEAYEQEIRRVAASGGTGQFLMTWTGRDGEPVVSDIRLVAERGRDGQGTTVITVGRDVTRMKRVEQELLHKTEMLSAVLDNLPGNSFSMRYLPDGQRRLMFTSVDVGGGDELSFHDFQARIHPDDQALIFDVVPGRLRRLGFSDHKFRFRRGDGAYIWLHSRERVRSWEGGDMIVDGLVFDVTEEMEVKLRLESTAAELRTTAQRLQALLDHLPGLAYRKEYQGEDSRITFTSAGFVDLMGRPFDGGSEQDRLRTIWHPDDREKVRAYSQSVREGADKAEVKLRFYHPDGSIRWVLLRERVVERREGFVAAEGLMFDITNEMAAMPAGAEAAEEQRATARRLTAILDNLPGLAYRKEMTGENSTISYASAAIRDFFGVGIEEFDEEARFRRMWHPDDHDLLRAHNLAVRNGKNDGDMKVRFFHKDGTIHWVHIRERVVERRDGFIASEGLLFDITEEMLAKEALEKGAQDMWEMAGRLRTLLSNLPGVIFRMEYLPDDRKHMVEWFGDPLIPGTNSSEDLMGSLIHPEDRELIHHDLADRLRTDGYADETFRMIHPDGRLMWVHTREKVVERDGRRMIVEGQMMDITAEVLMRQELEDSERRLRRAEARLQQGRRFESLGQFAGGIAHDFNNLLGAMLGYARFIEEDAQPGSDSLRHARRIIAAGEKGRGIVEQILNYARQVELQVSKFPLGDLISDVLSMCGADVDTLVEFVPDLTLAGAEIEADRVQLSRMLMNLCINARDAIGNQAGKVVIGAHQMEVDATVLRRLVERDEVGDGGDVETWSDADGTSWVVTGRLPKVLPQVSLYVADTGMGMEAKLLENAFTPFFTTKDRAKGTGLGLAVVQGIVMAHGGTLIGRSRPGEGTRIEVLLPVRRSVSEPMNAFGPVAESQKTRILVVEDNIDVLDATTEALKRLDFVVDGMPNAKSALEAFQLAPDAWDIVVSDQIMPGLRGIDLIRKVRTIRPQMPCVLCTGFAEELSQSACDEAGVAHMLRKPVGFRELVDVIERLTVKENVENLTNG